MTTTLQQTIPFGLEKLYNDALYLHLIHKGYSPKEAEREVMIRVNSKMRKVIESSKYIEKIKEELGNLPHNHIVLIETTAEKSIEINMHLAKFLSEKNDSGIIVSTNRPYSNLIEIYKENGIDLGKLFFLDCVSKNRRGEVKAGNVAFLENLSSLTDISISISDSISIIQGYKKFVFFDSINTILIQNKPHVFARFVYGVLMKMRLNGVGGVLISIKDDNNTEIRAEVAQLCDKVIEI